jgi:hypothetical protein
MVNRHKIALLVGEQLNLIKVGRNCFLEKECLLHHPLNDLVPYRMTSCTAAMIKIGPGE